MNKAAFKKCFLPSALLAITLFFLGKVLYAFAYALLWLELVSDRLQLIFQWTIYFALAFVWLVFTIKMYQSYAYRILTGRNFSKDKKQYQRSYQELVEYFVDAEPHKLDTSKFPPISWRQASGLVFGSDQERLIHLPSDAECNVAVFGPPGSGKTSGIAIINAITFRGSTLVVDIKGDIYNYVSKHTSRKIVRFCPDAPDALTESAHFNPFVGLNSMSVTERKLYIESMASVLIVDDNGSDGNYFTSRARKIFQGVTHLLLHQNPDVSFPDVIHAILEGNVFDWVTTAINSDCVAAKEQLASFYGNSEKNVSSAYDALTTALVGYSNPVLDELLSGSEKSISIDTLDSGTDIYLQINQEHLDSYAPLFTLIIQSFSTAFTRRPDSSSGVKNRPILMILDEFPQLTFSYKLVNANLSTLRSKSVICMILMQNYSQLEYRYQQSGSRSIIGNCNYHLILGSNDIASSKIFSDTFGYKKVLKVSSSQSDHSSGSSTQEQMEKVFSPEYFGDLAARKSMILYFHGKYCECKKLNCYQD